MTAKAESSPQPTSEKPNANEAIGTSTSGSVDQIRDILFGRQMSEYETRFKQLEERLIRENRLLREMLEQRIDDALQDLESERIARELGQADLIKEIGAKSEEIFRTQQILKKALSTEIMQVRDNLHEQGRAFNAKQQNNQETLAELLRQMADQLSKNNSHS